MAVPDTERRHMRTTSSNPDLDRAGGLFWELARDWDFLVSEFEGDPEREQTMLTLVPNTAVLERAGLLLDDMANEARVEGRTVSADALDRACEELHQAAGWRRASQQGASGPAWQGVEFLGMDEAHAANVVWSGQADDDSVLALVKHLADENESEFVVVWFTEREWQRVDGTARQWMFEYDPAASDQFDPYTDQGEAVAAAKAALIEHCGKAWS